MSEINERTSSTYKVEVTAGQKGKVWLDISMLDIEKDTASNIICEVEKAKENIKKILAG